MKMCIFKNKVWQTAWVGKIHVKLCPKLNSIEEQKWAKKKKNSRKEKQGSASIRNVIYTKF